MADLPDIDTSDVSFIAYWNAIEQGGSVDDSNWDPGETLSYNAISSSTTYDNGVNGTISLQHNRTANFRAKDDGWIVAYLDRQEDLEQDASYHPPGPWDIMRGWAVGIQDTIYSSDAGEEPHTQRGTFNLDALTNIVQGLFQETSVYGETNVSFSASDVGMYNYEVPGTNLSFMSAGYDNIVYHNGKGSYENSQSGSMSYPSGTDIHRHYLATVAKALYYPASGGRYGGPYHARVTFDGTTMSDSANVSHGGDKSAVATRLASNIGVAQNAGTSYSFKVENGASEAAWNNEDPAYVGGAYLNQLIIWS